MAKHDPIDVSTAFKAFSLLLKTLDNEKLTKGFDEVAGGSEMTLSEFFADNPQAVIAQKLLETAEVTAKASTQEITSLRDKLKRVTAELTGEYDDPAETSAKFHEKRERMFTDVSAMMERFAKAIKRDKPHVTTETSGDFMSEGKAGALELGFARLVRYSVNGYGTLGLLSFGPYVYVFSKWPQSFFGTPKGDINDFVAFVAPGSGKLQPRDAAEERGTLNLPAIYTKDGYGNRKLIAKPDFAFKGYDYAHVLTYIAGVLPVDASVVLGRNGSGESKPGAARPG